MSDISGTLQGMLRLAMPRRPSRAAFACMSVLTLVLQTSCAASSNDRGNSSTAMPQTDLLMVNGKATLAPGLPRCGREFVTDGTVAPVTCDDGRVNAAVFADIVKQAPRLFALPRTNNWQATESALCADYQTAGTYPILSDAYSYRYIADNWKQFPDYPDPDAFSLNLVEGKYCQ